MPRSTAILKPANRVGVSRLSQIASGRCSLKPVASPALEAPRAPTVSTASTANAGTQQAPLPDDSKGNYQGPAMFRLVICDRIENMLLLE